MNLLSLLNPLLQCYHGQTGLVRQHGMRLELLLLVATATVDTANVTRVGHSGLVP